MYKGAVVLGLLVVSATSVLCAEAFNPSAQIYIGKQDTHLAALELSRWCLDNGIKDDSTNATWEHKPTGQSLFHCVRETEGDGNEGSPTVVTFTYHFVRSSKATMRLEHITTSQGFSLSKREMMNALPGGGK